MRYDSIEHLAHWVDTGAYPAIHDNMAHAALSNMRGKCLLDLGCSYGLLGQRISCDAGDVKAVGIEANSAITQLARDSGVSVTFYDLKITRDTLPDLIGIIHSEGIDTLIARRVLPELWGADIEGGKLFAKAIAEAGVNEVFVEGRVSTPRATNQLSSIADEVILLSTAYREVSRMGAVSYLVRI